MKVLDVVGHSVVSDAALSPESFSLELLGGGPVMTTSSLAQVWMLGKTAPVLGTRS